MLDILSLFSVLAAFSVAAASPGPATLALATVAMADGRRRGLIYGAGLAAGLWFWGVVAATGLGAVLQASSGALIALKIFGSLYLFWLALQAARSSLAPAVEQLGAVPVGALFTRGLILNLSNPKAVIAWMAALAMGLGSRGGLEELMVTTLACMVLGGWIYAGYALVFSLRGAMAGYRRWRRWISGLAAGLFAIAGLGLVRSAS
ncbi:LysE family translocator [Pseudohoeflea coraliihabitans]|uniref:LysE family translocator n=1 Tax=Pseudohoeflea coraliihabitans TaxID=2860393 RepID=A0ABS6WL27_9HYPH|nr:LysE family translocator [Pseudohoeflea sp. DP4N28-3]MBW3095804.1 LysE family translocator [Pseudohoeflea sp. DP4N28-3]